MADNLDDFFAKKDKSKKKTSAKITPDDIMAMQEDELRRGRKQKKKTKEAEEASLRKDQEFEPQSQPFQNNFLLNLHSEDNEWKEIEDEVKDFSGLRIQPLAATNGDERGDDKSREGGGDDDEETQRREGGQQGPWNKGKQSGPAEPVSEQVREVVKEAPAPVKETPAAAPTPSKYVPPALRQAQQAAASSSAAPSPLGLGGKLKKKDAPNLKSEEDFPTLGGQEPEPEVGGVSYTTVGGRKADVSATQQRPQLQLGNKFTALGDH